MLKVETISLQRIVFVLYSLVIDLFQTINDALQAGLIAIQNTNLFNHMIKLN